MDADAWTRVWELLRGAGKPLWESELLRAAWPGDHVHEWSALDLYQRHFWLFAGLYREIPTWHAQGYQLHVHFMRTSLVPLPLAGHCGDFDAGTGKFCGALLPCSLHGLVDTTVLAEGDARSFYLDPSNVDWLDEARARALSENAWELLCAWPRADAAWRTLGLEPGASFDHVRRRYRVLVRETHPDSAGTIPGSDQPDGQRFREVQEAWQVLREVLPLLGKEA